MLYCYFNIFNQYLLLDKKDKKFVCLALCIFPYIGINCILYFNECYIAILIFLINISLECVIMFNNAIYKYNVLRFKYIQSYIVKILISCIA